MSFGSIDNQRYGLTLFPDASNMVVLTSGWLRSSALAPASLDLCGWVYGQGIRARPIDPHLVSARCDDGALFVSEPANPAYNIAVLHGGNYHSYDYQFVYMRWTLVTGRGDDESGLLSRPPLVLTIGRTLS